MAYLDEKEYIKRHQNCIPAWQARAEMDRTVKKGTGYRWDEFDADVAWSPKGKQINIVGFCEHTEDTVCTLDPTADILAQVNAALGTPIKRGRGRPPKDAYAHMSKSQQRRLDVQLAAEAKDLEAKHDADPDTLDDIDAEIAAIDKMMAEVDTTQRNSNATRKRRSKKAH